jgi:hypothetical protein
MIRGLGKGGMTGAVIGWTSPRFGKRAYGLPAIVLDQRVGTSRREGRFEGRPGRVGAVAGAGVSDLR